MVRLTTDKSAYNVGDVIGYAISGAKPDADIAWTSFKNGQPTGELNAQYGQYVDASGNWSGQSGAAWTAADTGRWEKQVLLVNPDGSFDQAQVAFTVGNVGAVQPSQPGVSGFLSGSTTLPLVGAVPNLAIIGILAFAAFALSGSGGKR